jgi:hypothetical protein
MSKSSEKRIWRKIDSPGETIGAFLVDGRGASAEFCPTLYAKIMTTYMYVREIVCTKSLKIEIVSTMEIKIWKVKIWNVVFLLKYRKKR